jgi:hypothetical protein
MLYYDMGNTKSKDLKKLLTKCDNCSPICEWSCKNGKLYCCTCDKLYEPFDYKIHLCSCSKCKMQVNRNIGEKHCCRCQVNYNLGEFMGHCCRCQKLFDMNKKKHCYRCHMFYKSEEIHICPIPDDIYVQTECNSYMWKFHASNVFCDLCLEYHDRKNNKCVASSLNIAIGNISLANNTQNIIAEEINNKILDANYQNDCKICYNKYKEKKVFVPCGHCCACFVCINKIITTKPICPICRNKIENVINLHES